jgi:hypothetical protein
MGPSSQNSGAYRAHFSSFVDQHGKAYAAEEYPRRKAVFERNMRLVQELNDKHAGRASFSGNRFLDMTAAEVLRFRGGKNRGSSRADRRSPDHWQLVSIHQPSDAV